MKTFKFIPIIAAYLIGIEPAYCTFNPNTLKESDTAALSVLLRGAKVSLDLTPPDPETALNALESASPLMPKLVGHMPQDLEVLLHPTALTLWTHIQEDDQSVIRFSNGFPQFLVRLFNPSQPDIFEGYVERLKLALTRLPLDDLHRVQNKYVDQFTCFGNISLGFQVFLTSSDIEAPIQVLLPLMNFMIRHMENASPLHKALPPESQLVPLRHSVVKTVFWSIEKLKDAGVSLDQILFIYSQLYPNISLEKVWDDFIRGFQPGVIESIIRS